jgi:hypothetical protein
MIRPLGALWRRMWPLDLTNGPAESMIMMAMNILTAGSA